MSIGPLADEELLSAYRAADDPVEANRCINELFARYHSRVAAWCLRLTGDREAAADLAQEVFMKAYRHLDSFQGGSKFSTWVYSIARNHCFNHLRSMSRRPEDQEDETLPEVADRSGEDALGALIRESRERRGAELMRTALDEMERRIMYLHYAEDVPLDAITRLFSLENASGAKAYIVSARRKLRRALERGPLS